MVPGMRVAAPRDTSSLREQLGEALEVDDGPTAIRFPKRSVGADPVTNISFWVQRAADFEADRGE